MLSFAKQQQITTAMRAVVVTYLFQSEQTCVIWSLWTPRCSAAIPLISTAR